ncbi:MAG: ASKHA domain-containing protein, partial [Nitrospinota bacterium]
LWPCELDREALTARAEPGASLLELAHRSGANLEAICGGVGRCGKCRVRLLDEGGDLRDYLPTAADREFLSQEELAEGLRLACQHEARGDLRVELPPEVQLGPEAKALRRREIPSPSPAVRRYTFSLSGPKGERPQSLLSRIEESLPPPAKGFHAELSCIERLPSGFWKEGGVFTATLRGKRLIDVEAGDTSGEVYGLVVDLGTTTISAYLVSLEDGTLLAEASRPNGQRRWGSDLIARISHASEGPRARDELRRAVISDINALLFEVLGAARVRRRHLFEVVFVGNTAMHHLFLGIDPSSLGLAPFAPVADRGFEFSPKVRGLRVHPAARGYFLPPLAGFVGADALGVILALGLGEAQELTLALDRGPNVEILLGSRHGLWCASTPAGPAFEGGEIADGMEARAGAIAEVRMGEGDLELGVIRGGLPAGLCGTGLIDAVALLLEAGLMDSGGRLLRPEELPASIPQGLVRRLCLSPEGPLFLLAHEGESSHGRPVRLTQQDIRKLQLAKAAVTAATELLLAHLGFRLEELRHIALAGAFGARLRVESAIRIGLLPRVPEGRVEFVGNAAAEGGRLFLLSERFRNMADEIKKRINYVELAGRPEFQELFIAALNFPSSVDKGEG